MDAPLNEGRMIGRYFVLSSGDPPILFDLLKKRFLYIDTADEQVEAVAELTQSALDSLGLKPGMIKPL